jgi:dsDNA-binding SOS-regulon protein
MAVVVKYIVVRNGVEKMTFVTKKEADAHDRMLDIADNLLEFLRERKVTLKEQEMEDISLLLAEHREKVMTLLKGAATQPGKTPGEDSVEAEGKQPAPRSQSDDTARPAPKPKAVRGTRTAA